MRRRKLLKRIGASGVAVAGLTGAAVGSDGSSHHARIETDEGTEIVPVAALRDRWDDPAAELRRRGMETDVANTDFTTQCELECCRSCTNCLCCRC